MSRTTHGRKGPGFEYWSRRKNKDRFAVGSDSKKWTHGRERREGKEVVRVPARD